MIGCLELGLLGQTLFIIISEYFTSHAFSSLKEAASDTLEDSSSGVVAVSSIATTCHLLFLGLAFIISPAFFLAINLFSYISEEALSFCLYSKDLP